MGAGTADGLRRAPVLLLAVTVLAGCGGSGGAEAMTAQGELNCAIRLERKRFKRLYKEIGAVPVLPGGGGGDEEPAGEDTQPA